LLALARRSRFLGTRKKALDEAGALHLRLLALFQFLLHPVIGPGGIAGVAPFDLRRGRYPSPGISRSVAVRFSEAMEKLVAAWRRRHGRGRAPAGSRWPSH